MPPIWTATALAIALLAFPTAAGAEDPCRAPLPTREGQTFSGRVDWIIDGDGLCVTTAGGMVEVRLADFDAPETTSREGRDDRARLSRIARGRWAVCTVARGRTGRTTSYDRVFAVCRIGGRRLGDLMRADGAAEGGR